MLTYMQGEEAAKRERKKERERERERYSNEETEIRNGCGDNWTMSGDSHGIS